MASAKATVLGKSTKADLPKELFAEPFHQSLVHEAARADLNARRQGTASTLTRGEVSFTTAKAWRPCLASSTNASAAGAPHTVRWARISHDPTPSRPSAWKARGTRPQMT